MNLEQRENIRLQFLSLLDNGGWARDGQEWDNNPNNGIILWSGEGNTINDLEAFDYYAWDRDSHENTYTMGIHNKIVKWADSIGAHFEAYDSGTYMLYLD